MINYHTNPAFHADMYDHYTCRLQDAAGSGAQIQFLTEQQHYHAEQYTRLMELVDMAHHYRVPLCDMIHLGNLVALQMEHDEACRFDADHHRVAFFSGTGELLMWIKTISPSPVKNIR